MYVDIRHLLLARVSAEALDRWQDKMHVRMDFNLTAVKSTILVLGIDRVSCEAVCS